MGNIEQIWQPSTQSLSGQLLEAITHTDLSGDSLCQRSAHVAFRCFAALALLLTMAIDLISWSMLTLSIVIPCRIGLKNHLLNLVSTLALPILAFTLPFGKPSVSSTRPFYKEIPPPPDANQTCSCLFRECSPEYLIRELWNSAEYFRSGTIDHLISKHNVSPNAIDPNSAYNTPAIFGALSYGRLSGQTPNYELVTKTVEMLLKHGASANPPTICGMTTTMVAASHLHKTVLTTFLERGVDPNIQDKVWNGNALYHTLWGTHWSGIERPDETSGVFCNASKQPAWGSDEDKGMPMDPKRMEVAQQLIQAETHLYDHHLTELGELYNALEQNRYDLIAGLIKRYPDNPFYRLAVKPGYILSEGVMKEERRTTLLRHMKRILDVAETLKKQKREIVDARTKLTQEALATCSGNGIPKELAIMISEYCYC